MPSLHEHFHLVGHEDRTFSFEEVIAVRNRLAGCAVTDLVRSTGAEVVDWTKVSVLAAALAEQDLRYGDLGPAFLVALSRTNGSIADAREQMITAFGRAPSRSYATQLRRAWQDAAAQRRDAAVRRHRP
ncbi:hypothetical protein [Nonomuraea typhae]|uniref:hypothetical protein n=1 Tax=Nonomuraea typhae TaxID=2603600 RepID=UPI0012FC4B72|nr:hypothetical protein [Nonomuraea typhae]